MQAQQAMSDSISLPDGALSKLPVAKQADSTQIVKPKRKNRPQKTSSEITSDIVYTAQDSIVMEGMDIALLYGRAQLNYGDLELKADFIRINLDSSTVYASGLPDSTGEMRGTPVFKEGSESIESKAIRYNMKSRKGFIYGTVTQQGEGYLTSQKTKKVSDDVYCLENGKYTTCDHHDHPHFYLALTKAKMKQGRYIVSGPAYMVVEDIPLPLAVPFGYFPINTTYSSGILFPTLGDEYSRGFYAKGLGYYFAINDYIDLA
ncbi:MAG: putative LPS assembly protein LptD, partial [Paludibacteraceae bacterium]|nr:putative LPS assembly protein LptD [Paludibacteraceae bacterium]